MEQKKNIGFGMRGTIMVIYQLFAFITYATVNTFGQNIQGSFNAQAYGWNASLVATSYTIVILISVAIQLIFGAKITNAKNVKMIAQAFMAISIVGILGMALVHSSEALWIASWCIAVFFSNTGCTLVVGVLVGQWFPRRKGTVMGIATLAFPIINGVGLSIFAALFFSKGAMVAWIPWILIDVIGIVLCGVFLKDYPEQVGAFADNDASMTPEKAKAIMEMEAEARKKSVWKAKNILKTVDFWLLVIPQGIILMGSVGAMTQVVNILGSYPDFYAAHGTVALLVYAIIACIGSYVLGLIDTKVGTKKAILISCILMIASGALGAVHALPALLVGFGLLQIFMGASSNFMVSSAAQYWRREDFPTAYSFVNPIANVIQAFGPMIVAMVGFSLGFNVVFIIIAVLGVIATAMILAFSPKRLAERDLKYREAAGLSTDEMHIAK